MLYANYNAKTQQTPRAKWSERPKPKPSETKTKSQKPWAISQVKPSEAKWNQVKPSEAKWNQVKPSEAKWSQSQKPKTKSQVGTQRRDSSSKMHAKCRF